MLEPWRRRRGDGCVCVCVWGDREKYLASFSSAIVFGTRCMHALQKMYINRGSGESLALRLHKVRRVLSAGRSFEDVFVSIRGSAGLLGRSGRRKSLLLCSLSSALPSSSSASHLSRREHTFSWAIESLRGGQKGPKVRQRSDTHFTHFG